MHCFAVFYPAFDHVGVPTGTHKELVIVFQAQLQQ